jgi:hypothetical protein
MAPYSIRLFRYSKALLSLRRALDNFEGGNASYKNGYENAACLNEELEGAKVDVETIRNDVATFFDPPIDWERFRGQEELRLKLRDELLSTLMKTNG